MKSPRVQPGGSFLSLLRLNVSNMTRQLRQNRTPELLLFIVFLLIGISFFLFNSGKFTWAITPVIVSALGLLVFFLKSFAVSNASGTLSILMFLVAVAACLLFLSGEYVWAATPCVVSIILLVLSVRNPKVSNLND